MLLGLFCFWWVGGGSMRYRFNKSMNLQSSINEDLFRIFFYILIPIIAFLLMKLGFKILRKK